MNERDALWAACLANPGDDTPRLALADRLQEDGFTAVAAALRSSAGRTFVLSVVPPPAGDLLFQLYGMNEEEREERVQALIDDSILRVLDSEAVASEIAMTNAFGWVIDEFEVEIMGLDANGCHARVTFVASGDHDEDRMFSGDQVRGTVDAVIDAEGRVEYGEVDAHRVGPDDDGFVEDE